MNSVWEAHKAKRAALERLYRLTKRLAKAHDMEDKEALELRLESLRWAVDEVRNANRDLHLAQLAKGLAEGRCGGVGPVVIRGENCMDSGDAE
jgi:hypothetical protein